MNKLIEQSRALRDTASKLEDAAEAEVLPELYEKYKDLVGTCYEITNSDGQDKWKEYFIITKIESFYNIFETPTVYILCTTFCIDHPYYGASIKEKNHTYLHVMEETGKQIPFSKFQKKFNEALKKVSVS